MLDRRDILWGDKEFEETAVFEVKLADEFPVDNKRLADFFSCERPDPTRLEDGEFSPDDECADGVPCFRHSSADGDIVLAEAEEDHAVQLQRQV